MRARTLNLMRFLGALAAVGFGIQRAAAHAPTRAEKTRRVSFQMAPLSVPKGSRPAGFTRVLQNQTGVRFTNRLSNTLSAKNRIYENGSGVALGDVDGDGRCDLYLCRLEGANALYRNRGGWRFSEIAKAAGAACEHQPSTGAALADLDGDHDLDLLVNGIGSGTRCFLNDGKGHFEEAVEAGLDRHSAATSLALADVDRDGDLDLYVAHYRNNTIKDRSTRLTLKRVGGLWQVPDTYRDRFVSTRNQAGRAILLEIGMPDTLYLNSGSGRFRRVDWTGGFFLDEHGEPLGRPPRDWSLSARFGDLNRDGYPDLYTCGDFITPDRCWINLQGKGFQAISRAALTMAPWSSMSVDFADIDRDGWPDIFVAEMLSPNHVRRNLQRANRTPNAWTTWSSQFRPQYMRNMLFRNRGDGTFAEIARGAGVDASDWTWSAIFLDVDLDGLQDLLIANGHPHDSQDADAAAEFQRLTYRVNHAARNRLRLRLPALHTSNDLFRNQGDGTFKEIGREWGFESKAFCQGMALGDLDHDGDLDVVINCLNSELELYRNEAQKPRVAVRLRGAGRNTAAVGSIVRLREPSGEQSMEVTAGGGYLSSSDGLLVFAMPEGDAAARMRIEWNDGQSSVIEAVQPNSLYCIDHPDPDRRNLLKTGSSKPPAAKSDEASPSLISHPTDPFFQDISERLGHVHSDPPFDDAGVQPLLSRRLSEWGPGVAWIDVDGDGWEDLLVGRGNRGKLGVFRNRRHGAFSVLPGFENLEPSSGESTSVVGWSGAGRASVLVGISHYESRVSARDGVVRRDFAGSRVKTSPFPVMSRHAVVGPLAIADVDHDGDLDLFVGGRFVAGQYPRAAASHLLKEERGRLTPDPAFEAAAAALGLVTGAVFSDLDGDGWPDLAVACDWGPLRVFRNRSGRFRETTRALGLDRFRGWWNSVSAGDFNGDGRMDLVAGNWGRNSEYQRYASDEIRMYFGFTKPRNRFIALESYLDPQSGKRVPIGDRDTLKRAFPRLASPFLTYRRYGEAGIDEILGPPTQPMTTVFVNDLDTAVFLNRGDRFEQVALPAEAQIAPVFGTSIGDFDGDGHEDLFLSQNFFGTPLETSPYDAGLGVLLLGKGGGRFRALSGLASGIRMLGQGRGSAVADFDHDGRLDLAAARHRRMTKLYRNRLGRPGLRIALAGPAGNPAALGAQVRLRFQDGAGPVREIHGGSGFLSCDAATLVLATPRLPETLWVRWPDGRETVSRVPRQAMSLQVDQNGMIEVLR